MCCRVRPQVELVQPVDLVGGPLLGEGAAEALARYLEDLARDRTAPSRRHETLPDHFILIPAVFLSSGLACIRGSGHGMLCTVWFSSGLDL